MREHRSREHGFSGQGASVSGRGKEPLELGGTKAQLGGRERTKEGRAHERGPTEEHSWRYTGEQPCLEGSPTSETLGHKGIAHSHIILT